MSRMAPARTKSAATTPRPGLRERKKIRTRQAIRHAAYRLFAEQGYDATSVDRIAHEAEVSPSTVFRYFPTKEDIVLTDEYDPLIHDALLARPSDEAPVTALRNAMLGIFEQATLQEPGREPAESHQRMQLVLNVPALRAR
ncbi:MAG TPA: helix-turn-helix domain-containing protein, partial [Streptomyces sp.]|nr:helix-turn-helix domain-containing protein [Streptomyces sp.]